MKKKLTLVLALCACLVFTAGLAACETDETSSSTPPPASSSPADSGPDTPAPETPIMPLTEDQWKALFTLENVTVTEYLVMEGQKIPITGILFNGADCIVNVDGSTIPLSGYAHMYRSMFDLSNEYDTVEYKNGQYYVPSHKPFGEGETEYSDLYVTVTDGVMTSVTGKMTDTYEGETTTEDVYIEFTNYGTTVVEIAQLPITEAQWRAAFDASKFDNITTTTTFNLEGIGDVTETLYYANGMEKIVVDFEDESMNNLSELYSVDGQWYVYDVVTATAQPIESITDTDYTQYTTISAMIKSFIEQGAEMYAIMSYDEPTDEYYYATEDTELRFTITEGVLMGYRLIMYSEDDLGNVTSSVYNYVFSGWGMTEFTVPFEVPEKTE